MLQSLLTDLQSMHRARFGAQPQWLASAPGRVNLIGDHTDYTEGFALPFAIDRYTAVSATAGNGAAGDISVYSTLSDEQVTFTLGEPNLNANSSQWHDYARGVLSLMRSEGFTLPPLSICVHGDLPVGSGLSSSASLELALATLIEGINHRQLDSREKIFLCQRAEHEYAGVPCGILDQFSICEAQSNSGLLLDCRSQTARSVQLAPEKAKFVVIDSVVRHQHSGGGYAARRQQCEAAQLELGCMLRDATIDTVATLGTKLLQKRARHVVSENVRVGEFAEALANNDLIRAGELMYASHTSLRDDYEVSCAAVDTLVEICRDTPGVMGARMTGGGFGGSVIVMAPPDQAASVASGIAERYRSATGNHTQPLLVDAVSGCTLHAANV